MKIYMSPAESGPGAWTGCYQHLLRLEAMSRVKKHTLTENPSEADIILITDGKDDDDFYGLRINPLLKKYPEKTFTIFEGDFPLRFVPGIYTSMPNSIFNLNRFRPGTYSYCHHRCGNSVDKMPPLQRNGELFFSFIGRDSHRVRNHLFKCDFKRPDVLIENSSKFNYFGGDDPDRERFKNRYLEVCEKSRFVLCPRGQGTSSIRLFEVMQMGLAPVIISDQWIRPVGPDWESFAVFVKENEIGHLPEILGRYDAQWRERGDRARKNWEAWYQLENEFNYLMDRLDEIKKGRWIDERIMRFSWPFILFKLHLRKKLSRLKRMLTG